MPVFKPVNLEADQPQIVNAAPEKISIDVGTVLLKRLIGLIVDHFGNYHLPDLWETGQSQPGADEETRVNGLADEEL